MCRDGIITALQRYYFFANWDWFAKKIYSLIPVFHRRYAQMFLDVFAEKRRVGEIHNFAYLFDTQVGIAEIMANLFQHRLGNPFARRLAGICLADRQKVFGRNAEFFCIKINAAAVIAGRVQEVEKFLKIYFLFKKFKYLII